MKGPLADHEALLFLRHQRDGWNGSPVGLVAIDPDEADPPWGDGR